MLFRRDHRCSISRRMTMKTRVLCAVSKGEGSVCVCRISCMFLLEAFAYEVLREETPGRISRKPAARPESRPPEPPKDHATNVTEIPELPVAGSTGQDKQPPNEVPVPVPIPATGVPETQQDGKSEANGADREAQATSAPPPEAALKAPEARSVQDQEATQPEPPQTLPEIAEGSQVPRSPQRLISRRQGDAQDQPEKVTTPEAPVESTQGPISPPKPGAQGSIRGAPQESQAPQRTSHPDAEGKRKRRDSSKDQPSPEHTTPEAAAVDKSAEPSQPPQPPQEPDTQDQADEQQQRPQREKRLSPRQGAKGKRKRQQVAEEQPPKDTTVPETTSAKQPQEKPDNQDHVEETSSKPREKRQRGRRPSSAQTSDKGKEPENRVIPDNALPIDSAKNRELPAATEKPSQVQGRSKDDATETRPRPQSPKAAGRKRAKRPAKKTARSEPREQEEEEAASGDEQAEPSTSTAAPEQPAEQEENSQPTRKRQSRGDTVPVTVHRLANLASLHGIPDSDSETDGSSGSADELSTRQKTKHPSRGGVNQADVLNQICRETLEKTLTTLKNGIANESNATRKAEWTRKKKAVEAYGTELEGRLFEMSEMLDSNFVLGVKLRRAKREMMEMRSRLYHVRRERETIAVRTDDVRKRFVEEERARIVSFPYPLHRCIPAY